MQLTILLAIANVATGIGYLRYVISAKGVALRMYQGTTLTSATLTLVVSGEEYNLCVDLQQIVLKTGGGRVKGESKLEQATAVWYCQFSL